MKVRDTQEVVSYVGADRQKGLMVISSANCGPVGLALGTAPQCPGSRQ